MIIMEEVSEVERVEKTANYEHVECPKCYLLNTIIFGTCSRCYNCEEKLGACDDK